MRTISLQVIENFFISGLVSMQNPASMGIDFDVLALVVGWRFLHPRVYPNPRMFRLCRH
jgi:hypothetical protein